MTPEEQAAVNEEIRGVAHSPGWLRVRALLREELDRILDVMTIETIRESDGVAVEICARQLAHRALTNFLAAMSLYEGDAKERKPPGSRFR